MSYLNLTFMIKRFTLFKRLGFVLLLLACWAGETRAQNANISGRVISAEDNAPLPGVSVVIKGTTSGTVTDSDGNYLIVVAKGNALVFSFLGTEAQEITIGDQTRIDVALKGNVTNLNEVVVTALGIRREKKAIGYSVTEIDGSKVSTALEVNAINSLSGKVAGVDISTVSRPPSISRVTRAASVEGSSVFGAVQIAASRLRTSSSRRFSSVTRNRRRSGKGA